MDILLLYIIILILFLNLRSNINSKKRLEEKLKNEIWEQNSLKITFKQQIEVIKDYEGKLKLRDQKELIYIKDENFDKKQQKLLEEYKVKIKCQRELLDKYEKEKEWRELSDKYEKEKEQRELFDKYEKEKGQRELQDIYIKEKEQRDLLIKFEKEKKQKSSTSNELTNEYKKELPNQKQRKLSSNGKDNLIKGDLQKFLEKDERTLEDLKLIEPNWDINNNKSCKSFNKPFYFNNEVMDSVNLEIEDIIRERGIQELVHFTDMGNLKSIMENGFLPIELQKTKNIKGKINDKERFDKKLNTTSFSLEFPNYKYLYRLRQKNIMSKWVIITLDPNILYLHEENIYYCENNAASKEISSKGEMELKSANSFEDMFKENLSTNYYGEVCRSNLDIPKNYSTDPQAEILIEGQIPNIYIRSIYFECNEDYDFAKDKMWNLISSYNIEINKKLFNSRSDYSYWKRRI